MKIEVLFDDSYIGGGNLGGRCNYWRGCLMDFIDVFNLTRLEYIYKFHIKDDFNIINFIDGANLYRNSEMTKL